MFSVGMDDKSGLQFKYIWATTWQNQQCGCAPSEDSDQPRHPPSLIRVFAVRMKKAWVLSYLLSTQQRLWSDWADAQADPSLRWVHIHFVGFVMSRLNYTDIAAHNRLSQLVQVFDHTWKVSFGLFLGHSKHLEVCVSFCTNSQWKLNYHNWAPSSEFVSSSIPSRQILTAHAQLFRGASNLAFCLTVPLDSVLVWASSGGSGETARMRRLAWTLAARIGDKYQIRLSRSNFGHLQWRF